MIVFVKPHTQFGCFNFIATLTVTVKHRYSLQLGKMLSDSTDTRRELKGDDDEIDELMAVGPNTG